DSNSLDTLAGCVYRHMFASTHCVSHVLLRDYARGVIERAVAFNPALPVVMKRLSPPYGRPWPKIPSANAIKPFLPDWSKHSLDDKSSDHSWARNRIGSSVMDDDFARYVIGTNSWSTNFLSLRLLSKQ